MIRERTPATRTNLLRMRRNLERVESGAALLKRKREALVSELFRLARPAADARRVISEQLHRAYPALLSALASHGYEALRATGWPPRDLAVEIEPGQVWGIPISQIPDKPPPVQRTLQARATAPGSAGPASIEAARRFEVLTDLLLDAAPREMRLRRLGAALSKTSRQLHRLEQRVGPRLQGEISRVKRALDEREREEHQRLKHIQRRLRRAASA